MPDPGLLNPETGVYDVRCPMCGEAIVPAGTICESCEAQYHAENEAIDADASLIRDAEIADEGWETTVEQSEDAA